ncbi:MAG TPA: hypothetical protein VGG14_05270 [Candidatus Sulfotelmatobacter sp.]
MQTQQIGRRFTEVTDAAFQQGDILCRVIAIPFPQRKSLFGFVLLAACYALAQYSYPEQEVHVRDLPSLTAHSAHAHDVLSASAEIVLNNKDVCCGKDSALEDSIQASDPQSLKDIAERLQGRHLLSDGLPVMITAEYLTSQAASAGHLITMISDQHAALMEWDSHLYVVEGITYVRTLDPTINTFTYTIHKLLLQDVRYSDSHRAVTFDRLTDDVNKVQGLLFLQVAQQ